MSSQAGAPGPLGAPKITSPGAPDLSAPNLSAPSLSAPSLSAPSLGAPSLNAPSLSAPSTAKAVKPERDAPKPRTRGWTMFLEASEDEEAEAIAATPASATTPGPASGQTQTKTETEAPADAGGDVTKPSVRGWTMIMDETEEAEAVAATPALPTPTPVVDPSSISTRGWTMLDGLNEGDSSPHSVAVSPPKERIKAKQPGKPSSRGWTMFMEAELEATKSDDDHLEGHEEDVAPDFYEGPVYTESGTVVSMAPTAENPNAGEPRSRMPAEAEPLTSFASRLHGDSRPEPVAEPETEPPVYEPPAQAQEHRGTPPIEPRVVERDSSVVGPGRPAPVEASPSNSTHYALIGLLMVVVIIAIYLALNP
jgi:hypothetical protein